MIQILEDAGPYSLTHTWNVDGTATDVGDVTIGIVDGTGTVVVAALTATTNNADGTYSYSLANQATPALLFLTWTRTDTSAFLKQTIEVVGSMLFTESEARAFDGGALSSTSTYSDADIAAARVSIGDEMERWTGRSWIERYCRIVVPGSGGYEIDVADGYARTSDNRILQRAGRGSDIGRILSAVESGTSVTTSNITPMGGVLVRTSGSWTSATQANPLNVVVEYAYGLPANAEGSKRIALLLLRDRLVQSKMDARTTSFSDELGTMQLVTAGRGRSLTNVPEVNQWLNDRMALGVV